MKKKKILFICKDNAIRSFMAAAFLNAYFGERFEAYSAGIEPSKLNPYTLKVLKEAGIDTSTCQTKNIQEFQKEDFDCVVTLCDYAKNFCAKLPRHKKELHKTLKNFCRPGLCDSAGKFEICSPAGKDTGKDPLTAFRYLREAIFEWVEKEATF